MADSYSSMNFNVIQSPYLMRTDKRQTLKERFLQNKRLCIKSGIFLNQIFNFVSRHLFIQFNDNSVPND